MDAVNDLVQQLHNREWLSTLLRQSHSKPHGAMLVAAVINLAINASLATYTRTWLSTATGRGLSTDLSALTFYLLVQPVIIGYLCWLQSSGQRLFEQMINEGTLESETWLRRTLVTCRDRLQSKWLLRGAALLSIAFLIWQIVVFTQHPPSLPWITSHPVIVWIRSPVDSLAFYALIIVIYDLAVFITALNDSLQNKTARVQPFHPDKAGGMGVVGRFAANLGYGIGAIGIALSLAIIQGPSGLIDLTDFALIIMLLLYLLLAPTIFFIPLWTAHSAMLVYRERLIKEVSKEFDSVFAQMQALRSANAESASVQALRSANAEQAEPLLKKIRQLDEERELIYQFPVWPFDSASLRKFFSLALSPLLPGASSLILNWVSRSF